MCHRYDRSPRPRSAGDKTVPFVLLFFHRGGERDDPCARHGLALSRRKLSSPWPRRAADTTIASSRGTRGESRGDDARDRYDRSRLSLVEPPTRRSHRRGETRGESWWDDDASSLDDRSRLSLVEPERGVRLRGVASLGLGLGARARLGALAPRARTVRRRRGAARRRGGVREPREMTRRIRIWTPRPRQSNCKGDRRPLT